ncbi:MAG: cupin domain-containing protein [Solirubrobacterales bacterium]
MSKVIKFPAFSDNEDDWQPIGSQVRIPDEDVLEGNWDSGRIHWIRMDDSRDTDLPLQSTVSYHPEDISIQVEMHGDEFIYVIEGEFTIELDSGETYNFQQGDALHLAAGLKGVWHYKAGFRQFVNIVYVRGGHPDRTEIEER